MKLITFLLGFFVAGMVLGSTIWANEGIIKLNPVNNSGSSCFVLSVFKDNHYQLLGSCRGLKTPYSAEETMYFVWRSDGGESWKMLGEIESGKFTANSNDKFEAIKVTAESDWNPRKPSEVTVASGNIEALPLTGSVIEEKKTESTITPTPTAKPTTKTVADETVKKGSILGVIGKIIGIGLLILLGVTIVLSVVTRRKGF